MSDQIESAVREIALVSTGGTIEMTTGSRGLVIADDINQRLLDGDVIPANVRVTQIKFSSIPSPHMTPGMIRELCIKLEELASGGKFDGIVVTHGTDTLEESAFLADVYLKEQIPVVFTAAMRSNAEMGVDGPRNLRGALLVAANTEVHKLGVTVVLNDEIHAAGRVTKTYTSNVSSFASPGYGPLGFVDQDRILLQRMPLWRLHLPPGELEMNRSIGLVRIASGFGAREIRFSTDCKDSGLVIEAFGRGNVPVDVASAVEYAVSKGTIVCVSSRCYVGRVLGVYDYSGGGADLEQKGAIFAGDMQGHKLRLLLMACISMKMNRQEIRELLKVL
ncbi:MAG: asparaginase [Candidatus Aegiribacteria sp.]|nr:asparaginase [Candidatus Aegiribacteria sp.]